MNFVVLKSKMVYVPPGATRKGYTRYDPRTKVIFHSESRGEKIINTLKNLLSKIIGLKEQGKFTEEQRRYVQKTLIELEPRMKYFKIQKQRMEVAKVIKQIRKELKDPVNEGRKAPRTKDGKELNGELREGLKKLGYSPGDVRTKTLHEIKAIYWNDIKK
jgi:hypothetical protein